MKKNYKRQITLPILTIFLALSLLLSFTSCRSGSTEDIETVKVARGDIIQIITSSGFVDASQQKNYSLQTSGEVLKSLKKGELFKKGDVILEVDNSRTQLLVKQAEENLKIAENSLGLAKLSYKQALDSNHISIQLAGENAKLSEQAAQNAMVSLNNANRYLSAVKQHSEIPSYQKEQAASSVDTAGGAYDQALINQSMTYWSGLSNMQTAANQIEITAENIKQAESQLTLSEISLNLTKLDLDDNVIYAPFDGVVLVSALSEGESVNPGAAAISIIKSDYIVKSNISETDILKLTVDGEVEITLDAYPEDTFMGNIIEISPISQNLGGIVSFEITVRPKEQDNYKLLYGLSANLSIITSKAENVLYIPIEAVYDRDNKNYVYVLSKDSKIEKREITTGLCNYDYIEIKKGLSEGETIIVSANIEDIESSNGRSGIFGRFLPGNH
jgi:multidrug efflux pump subunit AcrA (membrane-fusion protein)